MVSLQVPCGVAMETIRPPLSRPGVQDHPGSNRTEVFPARHSIRLSPANASALGSAQPKARSGSSAIQFQRAMTDSTDFGDESIDQSPKTIALSFGAMSESMNFITMDLKQMLADNPYRTHRLALTVMSGSLCLRSDPVHQGNLLIYLVTNMQSKKRGIPMFINFHICSDKIG